jgi:Flp pilus assembly protein TadD
LLDLPGGAFLRPGGSEIMAPFLRPRPLGPLALALLALAAAGCQTTHPTATADTTGSVGLASSLPGGAPSDPRDPRRELDAAGTLYRANAGNPEAAIRYATALRAIGERPQASAVLEQASIKHPSNKAVLAAYGRALADAGNYAKAFEILSRAHTPEQPDWRLLSVQGAVLDQMGRHEEARRYYASALKLAPEDPAVLSNLGLSYALAKDLKQAETILRRAARRRGAGAAESGAGGRIAGPLLGGGGDCPRRPAARGGRRQRRLSARGALGQERLEATRPHRRRRGRLERLLRASAHPMRPNRKP